MMPLTDKRRSLSPLIIFILVILPIFIGLYVWATPGKPGLMIKMNEGRAVVHLVRTSKVFDDTVFLAKDQALVLNRCRLVFKEMGQGNIHIDLYQLELDPHYAYPQVVSRKKAESGFLLAGKRFTLVSANSNRLKLKIQPN